jgi:DNA-binding transcriptional ArsR family regulator
MGKLDGLKLKQVIDPALAKVFTHPLRGHVWVTLFERGLVSPTEIANELGLEPSEVSYHFRKLLRKELIRLVRTEQRRGFDEHFYEPVAPALAFGDREWMRIPKGIRSGFSADLLRQVCRSFVDAVGAGAFDARNRHLSRTWLKLDERGWKEMTRLLQHTLERLRKIQRRSAERCAESQTEPISVEVVIAAFETVAGIAERQAGQSEQL